MALIVIGVVPGVDSVRFLLIVVPMAALPMATLALLGFKVCAEALAHTTAISIAGKKAAWKASRRRLIISISLP